MKRLSSYLSKYTKEAILAPLFKLLEALMDLLVPLVVAYIINEGITLNNKQAIINSFILLIVLAFAGMGFSFTAQYFAAKASVGFASDLRQSLFDHIMFLSYKELDQSGSDTLITRMTSDINQLQVGVNLALRLLLRSPFIVFGAMIMAFTIDARLALIFVVTIPILSLVVYAIMLKSIPLFEKVQQKLDSLLGMTRENLNGVRVIRAFCKEDDEIKEFEKRSIDLTFMNRTVGRLSALMNPLTYAIVNIASIVLIYSGALSVNVGTIRQGDVVALYNYMAQIIVELIKLASLTITINKSWACGKRVAALFDVSPSLTYPDEVTDIKDNTYQVEFKDVSFAYEKGIDAISEVSFKTKKGQTIGVIGSTGSGKSTIVNLIPRFYDVSEGEVRVDGLNVKDYSRKALLDKIAIVPQKAVLFEGTIRENMRWGKEDASDEEIYEALKTAQALEVVEGKKEGLDHIVEQGGRNFSGGQRQRLTIARALIKKPEILILDDSSSALDFATDSRLRKAISELDKQLSVFIVSQRTSSIMNADLILVMDDGKLVAQGTHKQLLKESRVYQEIYYSQFPEEAGRQEVKVYA
ncbi:MAG: ABC transporter ATP-binding protein/permease [Erysipelotrichaceae bacterium]|nr:ABC transporter ATP-binding protein/permease [Erysipelotrichaceae bacterium]